LFHADRRTWRQ
jgi:hypothetical protein